MSSFIVHIYSWQRFLHKPGSGGPVASQCAFPPSPHRQINTHTHDNVKQRSPDNFTMPGQINEQFSIPKFSTQAIPRAGGGRKRVIPGKKRPERVTPGVFVCVCLCLFRASWGSFTPTNSTHCHRCYDIRCATKNKGNITLIDSNRHRPSIFKRKSIAIITSINVSIDLISTQIRLTIKTISKLLPTTHHE